MSNRGSGGTSNWTGRFTSFSSLPPVPSPAARREFFVDGAEHVLGRPIQRGPRVAVFSLGRNEARLTMRSMAPSIRAAYGRSLRKIAGSSWRRMPLTILAYVLGGAGVGGGVAAAAATSSMISWTIYGLTVGEEDQGSWVLTILGGTESSWVFVEPGGPLPERDWLDWPAPRR